MGMMFFLISQKEVAWFENENVHPMLGRNELIVMDAMKKERPTECHDYLQFCTYFCISRKKGTNT
jgi:hypothetical protein